MASSHSYRSPSPPPSKHTDLRNTNSENSSSLRRSFSSGSNPRPSILKNVRRFDPVTPANSPSDFAVRRSMSKESTGLSSSKDCEEKENDAKDHNLKACKQSQAKGSKNFMSPTISASSKFTPSPRKKVLVERNDPVRTSMALSNGKAVFFSTISRSFYDESELKSEMATRHNEESEGSLGVNVTDPDNYELVHEDPPLPKPVKRVTFSDVPPKYDPEPFSGPVVADSDHFHVESSAKDSVVSSTESAIAKDKDCHSSVLSSIAPLDADPLCPPYDPVNNYLSPRPRFLHYKPNPRIEILSNIQSGLEDSLMGELISENFSESESTEESQREDSSTNGESEVAASADLVLGAVETKEDILLVDETYESLPVNSSALRDDNISEENCIPKPEKKAWALSRSFLFFSMLLMVIIAGVSISFIDPKALNGIVPKDPRFSDLYSRSEFIASAKEKFDWLTNNVNQITIYSVSFVSKLINELCGSEKLGPLHYMNLTDLQKNPWVGNNFLDNNEVRKESDEIYNEHELEDDRMEKNVDGFEEEPSSDVDEIFVNEFQTPDEIPETDEMSQEDVKNIEFQSKISHSVEEEASSYVEGVGSDDILKDELQTLDEIPETDEMLHENQEQELVLSDPEQLREVNSQDELHATTAVDQESVFSGDIIEVPSAKTNIENVLDDVNNDDCSDCSNDNELMDLSYSTEDIQTSVKMDTAPLANKAIAISSLFAAIFAVAALLIRLRRSPTSSNVAAETNHPSLSSNMKRADQENTVSHNWDTEVESMNNSEMSGLQQKTASSTKREEMSRSRSEVQGLESKANRSSRRESLASSSSEFSVTPSYGSFTSYEKAAGEEKFLTPVRRSSRIRNRHQITSS